MKQYPVAFVANLKGEDERKARISEIALKWARIAREKAKEDCSTQKLRFPHCSYWRTVDTLGPERFHYPALTNLFLPLLFAS